MHKLCRERPYAEVGTAVVAFQEKYPNGDGWSRGDKLEALHVALAQSVHTTSNPFVWRFWPTDANPRDHYAGVNYSDVATDNGVDDGSGSVPVADVAAARRLC